MKNKMYTVVEAARLFKRSPSVIYKKVKSGEIYTHGRPIKISHQALMDFSTKRNPAIPHLFERPEVGQASRNIIQ